MDIEITNLNSKPTPVDLDSTILMDSEDPSTLKKLTWANLKATLKTYFDGFYVALTGTQTIAGAKTLSGQTELTGQAATNSTSAMTRSLVGMEDFFNIGQLYRPLGPADFSFSGAGAYGNALTGWTYGSISSGTANNGYGWVGLAKGVNNNSLNTGGGAFFNKKLGVSIRFSHTISSFTDVGNVLRLCFGSDRTPSPDGTAPINFQGFGVEIKARGSSIDWRTYGHDGTTLTYSAWSNTTMTTSAWPRVHSLMVISDGAGGITAYLGINGSRSLVTISGTGAPTTQPGAENAWVAFEVANSASGTTALESSVFDCILLSEP